MPVQSWAEGGACQGHPRLHIFEAVLPPPQPIERDGKIRYRHGYKARRAQLDRWIAEAKQVCASCPVQARCLEDALGRSEPNGIWGGLTPEERRKLALRAA